MCRTSCSRIRGYAGLVDEFVEASSDRVGMERCSVRVAHELAVVLVCGAERLALFVEHRQVLTEVGDRPLAGRGRPLAGRSRTCHRTPCRRPRCGCLPARAWRCRGRVGRDRRLPTRIGASDRHRMYPHSGVAVAGRDLEPGRQLLRCPGRAALAEALALLAGERGMTSVHTVGAHRRDYPETGAALIMRR